MRRDIVERTDGIPLFVEEMTKAVLEAGNEDARRPAAAIPSAGLAVPASLHASLMARLDRLGPAKETAQIGAAIGPRILSRAVGGRRTQTASRTESLARPSHCLRFAVPAWRAATCDLPVQARAGAGRRAWRYAARAAPRAPCPHCQNP